MAMISATEFDECAAAVGGMKKLADAMNVSLQTITNWRSRGVPSSECRAFESVTGIGVQRLRDDWAKYWPEHAKA